MLNKDNVRELAYVVKIDNIVPHSNADRLEIAIVNGWRVIVGKGEFKAGDLAIYFEIDSKLPEIEPWTSMEFLASKHFKIKTQKLRGELSQGFLASLDLFEWGNEVKEGDFLTEKLGVTYAVVEDNKRKSSGSDKYKAMAQRHPKQAKTWWWRWLWQREWGKKLLFLVFGKKTDKKKDWPGHIAAKTDVERIQNMVYILNDKRPFVASEKIDGSSCSIMAERTKFGKIHQYICSRNVVFDTPEKMDKCYYDTNIYVEAYNKYNIGEKIEQMLNDLNLPNIAVQCEVYGAGVQKRDYSLKGEDRNIAVFHIVSNNVKMPMDKVVELCEKYDLPHVPIVNDNYILPDTLEELQTYVEGEMSAIDNLPREGIVFYDKETGTQYFKFVSPEYLLKYHG